MAICGNQTIFQCFGTVWDCGSQFSVRFAETDSQCGLNKKNKVQLSNSTFIFFEALSYILRKMNSLFIVLMN